MVKKEEGNGVIFALCLMIIMFALPIFYFLLYQQKMLVVKEDIVNGMQICENYILTEAWYEVDDDLPLDREQRRKHVVTLFTEEETLELQETLQVQGLTRSYLNKIVSWFSLNSDNVPVGNTLEEMCAGTLLVSSLKFYEAVYDGNGAIASFILYDVSIVDNDYVNCTKALIPLDEAKLNGRELRGSTIYSQITYDVAGPKHMLMPDMEETFDVSAEAIVDIVVQ